MIYVVIYDEDEMNHAAHVRKTISQVMPRQANSIESRQANSIESRQM